MRYAFSVDAVRAAEERLLAQQSYPDQLMQLAAHAVADAAAVMLAAHPGHVMILAGSGGNGGDGLFAGALLANRGTPSQHSYPRPVTLPLVLRSRKPAAKF
ncbi:Uncharacterized conserved protein [Corynebacterium striatum]|uniref:NAD(P)H-hydrate epimerase n=1 Tax=Corynebacterium striatum TaxID=43770 RepID=UPI000E07129A|nr:Uncharacterized conserved protein [Corynebacterium striatum]